MAYVGGKGGVHGLIPVDWDSGPCDDPRMPVWRGRMALAVVAGLATLVMAPSANAALPPLAHLRPGAPADVHQRVPVTVVLVGLEPGGGATGIDAGRLLASQLQRNRVVDRTTRFYEREGYYQPRLESAAIGITYDYDYRTVFAGAAFEDAFFGHLASIALGPIPGGTVYQQAYSAHPLAAQPIPASYLIDATEAERWLAANAGPMLGVDTTRPTVFFLNWFGRPDFRFHTYAFFGQSPDLPFPFGATHEGQMQAWGGSPPDAPYGALGLQARLWFYDVSAGPEWTTANWLLDLADFTGDGVAEERIPPVWEYGTDHWYRPFDDLTADLAKLLRFVAVDALFGASPIYEPAISEPLLADRVEVDLNLFAGRPRDPGGLIRTPAIPLILGRLDPTRTFSVDTRAYPLTGRLSAVYDCQQSAYTPTPRSCFGNAALTPDDPTTSLHDGVFRDLELFFNDRHNDYLDGVRYEIPVAAFDVPEARLAPNALAGYASLRAPNIQAWNFLWLADRFRAFLSTDTGVIVHEVGHHVGLSHVHDTYDPVLDADVSAVDGGPFWFMYSGTQTYTAMSYLPNTEEFGQFDRDHMARWQVAARLDNANRILGDVARSPRAGRAAGLLAAADAKAGAAVAALEVWDLLGASQAAAESYRLVLAAAAETGVKVEPFSGIADQTPGAGVVAGALEPRHLRPPSAPGAGGAELTRLLF
jgi:hypothetical protein